MAFLTAEKVKSLRENTGGDKRYLNISKIPDGQPLRLRFFGEGITGFLAWSVDRKPLRWPLRPETLPEIVKPDDNGDRLAKFFLCGICWDYSTETFRVIEITQKGIIGEIHKYLADEDYGDPTQYDISITRTGSGLETKYEVVMKPPKPPAASLQAKFEALDWDLNRLFDGEHPWPSQSAEPGSEAA